MVKNYYVYHQTFLFKYSDKGLAKKYTDLPSDFRVVIFIYFILHDVEDGLHIECCVLNITFTI